MVIEGVEKNAFGGSAVARDKNGRPIFVQGALPGETVRAHLTVDKGRFAHAIDSNLNTAFEIPVSRSNNNTR